MRDRLQSEVACARPLKPITTITMRVAAAMNINTRVVPNYFRMPAMKNYVNIAEKWLKE
jgi:hypothetical protein